jgi:hypothetical protein
MAKLMRGKIAIGLLGAQALMLPGGFRRAEKEAISRRLLFLRQALAPLARAA